MLIVNSRLHDLTISPSAAATLINQGGVGVLPTDTVYGLVARAEDRVAVAKLYGLKDRNNKPGTIIAANTAQLIALGVEEKYIDRVKNWWPNSLSVETPLGVNLSYLHQDTGRQGFRVVADPDVVRILEITGPLLTSSANHPGKPGSVNLHEAWDYFKDSVDFYVDGGDRSNRLPSTIISIKDTGEIDVIRQGAVDVSMLERNED